MRFPQPPITGIFPGRKGNSRRIPRQRKDDGVKDASPAAVAHLDETYQAAVATSSHEPLAHRGLPPLLQDKSFWGMTATQFLGAFNDNLFKQLMLLLAVPIAAAAVNGVTVTDQQGLATIIFSLPFVLFSGFAGYLSDRFSKQRVIVACKVAEIVIMLLGLIGFLMYGVTGYAGLLAVLFLMGMHSAFFGPGKYGILPELFRGSDLPRANGIILMTTFLAIIFGTATAGFLGDLLIVQDANGSTDATRMWLGSLACLFVAGIGTATSLLVRHTAPAVPDLKFQASSLAIPPDTRAMLWNDRPLMLALLASCMFWLVSGLAMQVVNNVGLNEMNLDPAKAKTYTSGLNAIIGIGIAIGAVVAGRMCRGKADFRIVRAGAWGIVVCLAILGMYTAAGKQLIGFYGSLPVLVLLGMSAGCFAIPVQVFIQARPPEGQKGRMIAVMNQANFVAIMLSGVLYALFDRLVTALGLPHAPIFMLTGLLILPVAIFYRPQNVEL